MWRILTRPRSAGRTNVPGIVWRQQTQRGLSSGAPDGHSEHDHDADEFRRGSSRRSRDGALRSGGEHGTARQDLAPALSPPSRRNAKLAAVIREGHSLLQAGSVRLQEASARTIPRSPQSQFLLDPSRRTEGEDMMEGVSSSTSSAQESMLPSWPGAEDDELRQLSVEQIAEGHRLLGVASDVLEAMCRKSSDSGLVLSGEPIVLLHVRVHKNLRSAVIYWTLPLPILWDDAVSDEVKLHMVEWFDERMRAEGSPQRRALQELTRRVAATLRSYRVPRIAWRPAPPDMMLAFQAYQMHGDDIPPRR